VREIRPLRARWRGLETECWRALNGHEAGNGQEPPAHHRASPRPYPAGASAPTFARASQLPKATGSPSPDLSG
jgi:hypothetical protein